MGFWRGILELEGRRGMWRGNRRISLGNGWMGHRGRGLIPRGREGGRNGLWRRRVRTALFMYFS